MWWLDCFGGKEGVYVDDSPRFGAADWAMERNSLPNNATLHHVLDYLARDILTQLGHVIHKSPLARGSVQISSRKRLLKEDFSSIDQSAGSTVEVENITILASRETSSSIVASTGC